MAESLGKTSVGHAKSSLRLRSGDSGTFTICNVVHSTTVAVGVLGFLLSANASTPQTIIFPALPNTKFTSPPSTPAATASSGLPASYARTRPQSAR